MAMIRQWNTAEPIDPEFERSWRERLAVTPQAHFSFDPAYLAHEARHGRTALAALADDEGRRGLVVLRRTGGTFTSGWPWRWQAMIEGAGRDPEQPAGMSEADADWLFATGHELADGARLRMHLPVPVRDGVPSLRAGATILEALELDEDRMFQRVAGSKRRDIRKAIAQGYRVVATHELDHMRAFAGLQISTERRRGRAAPTLGTEIPAPGESWREWELPWMSLLVALKDGRVEAGSGFGRLPGRSVDYRTNASSETGKQEGANALLAWEAMRTARADGFRWINWCGATRFKRDLGGIALDVSCRLGGGPVWTLPNRLAVSISRTRTRLGTMWRSRTAEAPRPRREKSA